MLTDLRAHCRTVSWVAMMPRAASNSSNHAKPERETEIQPDGMADDLGQEPIPGIAGASRCPHPTRLLALICRRKRMPPRLTVPVPQLVASCMRQNRHTLSSKLCAVRAEHRPTDGFIACRSQKAVSGASRLQKTFSGRCRSQNRLSRSSYYGTLKTEASKSRGD